MSDCLFCRIAAKEIKSDLVAERDDLAAFRDINPQAPTHVLVIPKKHIETLNVLEPGDEPLVGRMLALAREIAKKEGIAESGWRAVFNVNRGAGQTVFHIHLHVLGGRPMEWPPG